MIIEWSFVGIFHQYLCLRTRVIFLSGSRWTGGLLEVITWGEELVFFHGPANFNATPGESMFYNCWF